jgi:hypothetical protein
MAPQAIVMKTNGKTLPGMIGPPPPINGVTAGIRSVGITQKIPSARKAIEPSFIYELR